MKTILLFIALSTALLLTSCGKNSDTPGNIQNPPDTTSHGTKDTLSITPLGATAYTLSVGTDSVVALFNLHIPANSTFDLEAMWYGAYSGSVPFSLGHIRVYDSTGNKIAYEFDMREDHISSYFTPTIPLTPGNHHIKYTATPDSAGTLKFVCELGCTWNGVKQPASFQTVGPTITAY